MTVNVQYGQQCHRGLELLIAQGAGPSLLGLDWLRVVRLDWRSIGKVSTSTSVSLEARVAVLQDRYQEVFSEKLGTITHFQAKLSVKPEAAPKFFKLRPVPFAIRGRVANELDRLEQDGIIEKTHYS